MAIVVTKQPLDFKAFNELINQQRGSYEQRVSAALRNQLIPDVRFSADGGNIGFEVDQAGQGAVAMMVEVNKR
jgi:hypothetical protein